MKKDLAVILILILGSLFAVYSLSNVYSEPTTLSDEVAMPVEGEAVAVFYGIPLVDMSVSFGQVKKNQFLSGILLPAGVNQQQLAAIAELPREDFDVRKIRPGNRYALFTRNDSLNTPVYFVYEKDLLHYAVVKLEDSVCVSTASKPVRVETKSVTGEINSSLWEAMKEQNTNPMLAVDLSEIYAWSIDFFGLQQGDRFKVIYEEQFVDSVSAGIGLIHGAWFYHAGNEFWAIPFEQDSVRSYFDEQGNSLRKAFLKAPLRYSHISSGFSNSRLHPILKIRRPHHGVDYAAPEGTPVQTIGDGQVVKMGWDNGGGNFVRIKHNGVYSTVYMHLRGFAKGIRQGAYVHQGDVIGYVGHTGLATGPHLDFRFYKNGQPVNPLKVEAPPVEPVKEENLPAFDEIKIRTMSVLQAID